MSFPIEITIKNLNTAKFLRALLNSNSTDTFMTDTFSSCGGSSEFKILLKSCIGEKNNIWDTLNNAIAGYKPVPPTSIEDHDVVYKGQEGIKVGCTTISVAQMEAMLEECGKT